jgi:murein DD-endopeptidase MepM/ murein hydrolase activator NlpD
MAMEERRPLARFPRSVDSLGVHMVSLSLDPPPTSREGRSAGGGGRRTLLFLALGATAAGGFVLGRWTAPGGRFPVLVGRGAAPATPSAVVATTRPAPDASAAPQPAAAPAPAPTPVAPAAVPAGQQAAVPPPAPPAPAAAPAPAPAVPSGPRRISATLNGALEETITAAMPPADRPMAEGLTQVVNRLLVWDLQVARDGRRGDTIEIVYGPPAPAAPGAMASPEPVVEAVRYNSQKLMRTVAAYRFQAPGARWARYYRPDGSELEARLVDTPIDEYDQITSLLKDGRHHKGVDFRTPVGTPVHVTFDGVIERRNWNFAGNGNCLDVHDPATGRHAIFLHLEVLPKDMVPGRKVKKGEQIALSGNSGHSFAPHLHYQLESADGRVLDPFEVQPVTRVALPTAARPVFDAARARLDAALGGATVAAGAGTAGTGSAAAPAR